MNTPEGLDRLLQRISEGLGEAVGWFDGYADQHFAKGTLEADQKGLTNRKRAGVLHALRDEILAELAKPQPAPDKVQQAAGNIARDIRSGQSMGMACLSYDRATLLAILERAAAEPSLPAGMVMVPRGRLKQLHDELARSHNNLSFDLRAMIDLNSFGSKFNQAVHDSVGRVGACCDSLADILLAAAPAAPIPDTNTIIVKLPRPSWPDPIVECRLERSDVLGYHYIVDVLTTAPTPTTEGDMPCPTAANCPPYHKAPQPKPDLRARVLAKLSDGPLSTTMAIRAAILAIVDHLQPEG